MENSFQIRVETINGEIQAFPPVMDFPCEGVIPIGLVTVRDFDEKYDIVATKVFLFNWGSNTFGTRDFTSVDEFMAFKTGKCTCCADQGCGVYLNDCLVTLNGCVLNF